jgi:proteasome lid subunit RPN8/RPN11
LQARFRDSHVSIQWTDTSEAAFFPIANWAYDLALASTNLPHVAITKDAAAQMNAHLIQTSLEQGGLLLGRVFRSHDQLASDQFDSIVITQAVAATAATGTEFSLRMEAQVWQAANALCLQLGEHTKVVGWYHSHPGLGAFFSSTDCQTQAAFFNHSYSVGIVIDPTTGQLAGFIGAKSQPIQFIGHE